MITEKQKQIIKLLLTAKDGYNINQIAKILNISVSWTHEALRILEKEKIVISKKMGNAIFFTLNWDNQKTEKICDLILLDSNEGPLNNLSETENKFSETQEKKIENNQSSFYKRQISEFSGNSYGIKNSAGIESPYRQASAQVSISSAGYGIAPVGEQGVKDVLFSYANTGAFGSSGSSYSSSEGYYGNNVAVPPDTLGSKISRNVSGFSMVQHTSTHKSSVSGCRYCGPEIKL